MTLNKQIADRMKSRRLELKLSQEDLGAKLNIAQNTYHRWESGEKNFSIEEVKRIAKALYVNSDYLTDEDPDSAKDDRAIQYIPIINALDVASARGLETDELIDEAARFIRFRSEEEAKKRGA